MPAIPSTKKRYTAADFAYNVLLAAIGVGAIVSFLFTSGSI